MTLVIPRDMSDLAFIELIRSRPVDEIVLALEQVATYAGAMRIFLAERRGRNRWRVLLTANRRLEQLGGSEAPGVRTSLVAAADALEPGQR